MSKKVGFIFSPEMAPLLLYGTKLETRRLAGLEAVNESPDEWHIIWQGLSEGNKWQVIFGRKNKETEYRFSKAAPGDVIWCRETFLYRAQKQAVIFKAGLEPTEAAGIKGLYGGWKSPIHLPERFARWSSPCVEVRCERLHEITETGAIAEGITIDPFSSGPSAKSLFAELWERVNGPGSWERNDWIFCYRWKPTKP